MATEGLLKMLIMMHSTFIRALKINSFKVQSSLAITLSPGGIFWNRVISEERYRFCRQVFFLILYIFFECKLLHL